MDRSEGNGRHILVVAGPGRSGTSLFAGLAGRLGWHIPKPEVIANRSNPRGFGEPRWAVDFHNSLLRSVAVTIEDARPPAWDRTGKVAERAEARRRLKAWLEEQFEQSERLVVKDPRLAWFLRLYFEVSAQLGADVRVATMLRDPAEVVRSREIAYGAGTQATTRIAGWLNLMLNTEAICRPVPHAVVRYEDLLSDWRSALERAGSLLALPLVEQATPDQVESADGLVDPSLRRSVAAAHDEMGLPVRLRDLMTCTYDTFAEMATAADGASFKEQRLDQLREDYESYYQESAAIARSSATAARAAERRRLAREQRETDANHEQGHERVLRLKDRARSWLRRR